MGSEMCIRDSPNYVPVKFSTDPSIINSILIDEDKNCMFIGNNNEDLVQYSLDIRDILEKSLNIMGI